VIILDSDVISALMARHQLVKLWADGYIPQEFWTTSVVAYEVRRGITLLPSGKKQRDLDRAFVDILDRVLAGRVLPFDARAAHETALLSVKRTQQGLNVGLADTMIAGIAIAHGADVATGNVKDFRDLGARVINPWDASSG